LYRGDQMALLAGLMHDRWSDPVLGERLEVLAESNLASNPHSDTGCTIREIKRRRDRKVRLPKSLVEEMTRTCVQGQQVWQEARGKNDFASFRPLLEKIIRLKRQEADALGYEECLYDALLEDYEPGQKTSTLREALGNLRDALVPLVAAIADSGRQADLSILERSYAPEIQKSFASEVAQRIGFEFDRGRLDVTAHPFCTTLGPDDCRITTRYQEHDFGDAFFSVLHEAGHGIYEQGLHTEAFGLPLGCTAGLGVHESQSRLWENQVGRSRAFWDYHYKSAQKSFPDALGSVSPDDFYWAVNAVRPSLIRTEADEVTYNLHVLIRFELEQDLLSGDLPVSDLPEIWNQRYQQYLGITPPSDSDGVLQDIHWSAGLMGYFPTYSLGNLYAAQLFARADEEVGPVDEQFRQGEFRPLRNWLREKVHHEGHRYLASELMQRATGQELSHEPLIDYLTRKLTPLYELS
jgi:carboxypeptidase Taq